MDLGLKGKTALVFGAGGGLGGGIAASLAAEGARVVLAGRREDTLRVTAERIAASGGNARVLVWDLADLDATEGHVLSLERDGVDVDILINNTGGPPPTPAAGQDPALWLSSFQSLVLSLIGVTDRVLPKMRSRGWGRIITSTSSGVVAPIPNLGISNALRLSLVGWSKTLAAEVAREGITCNVVVPGRIATSRVVFLDEQRGKREGKPAEVVSNESAASIPLGRYGNPQEYGDVVAFLASERASYVTGSVVRIDGGYIQGI